MPDSQSREPRFESLFATVSKIGHFRSLHWRPCWFSCINEYLAIDSGGHVSDVVVARNCCMARMLPGDVELVSQWTGLPGRAKRVQRFERSNGLHTIRIVHYAIYTLYKNYLYILPMLFWHVVSHLNSRELSWDVAFPFLCPVTYRFRTNFVALTATGHLQNGVDLSVWFCF